MSAAITQAQLNALKTSLYARFNQGLQLTTKDWQLVAKLIASQGKSNTYAWLSQFPAFREWVGSRLHKKAAETAYVVVNKKFESTLDISRDDIEDDELGQYGAVAESQGQAASDLMNDLVFAKFAQGFTEVCYDGQFFFDTDHPIYANEDGSGAATVVSNMQAGSGAPWILLCTNRAPKPVYLQERIKPTFESLTDATSSDQVFNFDTFSFGARWRGDAAFGFWQLAQASKADLTPTNFDAAYDAMLSRKGDGNRKLGIKPNILLVGPSRRAAAEKLLLSEKLAGGESNTNFKRVELLVTPFLD